MCCSSKAHNANPCAGGEGPERGGGKPRCRKDQQRPAKRSGAVNSLIVARKQISHSATHVHIHVVFCFLVCFLQELLYLYIRRHTHVHVPFNRCPEI